METIYDSQLLDGVEQDVETIAKASDLDWEIVKKPLLYYDDQETLVRSSRSTLLKYRNGKLERELVSSGKDLKPIQPKAIIETYLTLQPELGLSLITAGHTRDGKHLYLIACRGDKEVVGELGFRKCLLFTSSNDGNYKTRVRPISFNIDTGVQLTQSRSASAEKESYSLSHHYDYNATEASREIQMLYGDWDAYYCDLEELASFPIDSGDMYDFHHRMYDRFTKGNDSTKRKYDIVMNELSAAMESTRKHLPPRIHNTLLELVVSFWDYIDFRKHRKGTLSGKIHAVNFAADELTKRSAFYVAMAIASEKRKALLADASGVTA